MDMDIVGVLQNGSRVLFDGNGWLQRNKCYLIIIPIIIILGG